MGLLYQDLINHFDVRSFSIKFNAALFSAQAFIKSLNFWKPWVDINIPYSNPKKIPSSQSVALEDSKKPLLNKYGDISFKYFGEE